VPLFRLYAFFALPPFVRVVFAWPVLELSTPLVFVVSPHFVSLLIALFALHGLYVVEIDLLS
jgi:hypothetical protein